MPGHGQSSYAGPYTFADLAEDLAGLLTEADVENPLLVGYSSGALVVLHFLLEQRRSVRGAVLMSGFPQAHTLGLRAALMSGEWLARSKTTLPLGFPLLAQHALDAGHFKEILKAAAQADHHSVAHLYRISRLDNITSHLCAIHSPTLLLYRKGDAILRPYARLLHRTLPNSRLVFIPRTLHPVPVRAAAEANRLMARFDAGLE